MRPLVVALALLSLAPRVQAQVLPTHGTPDRAAYASPAEWVRGLEAQGHWCEPGVNDMRCVEAMANYENPAAFMPSHTHCGFPRFPLYAETHGDVLTVPFVVKNFDLKGRWTWISVGTVHNTATLVFDTPSPVSALFPMMGTLKTWGGTATVQTDDGHNWSTVKVYSETTFDNSTLVSCGLNLPIYVNTSVERDPTCCTQGDSPQILAAMSPFPADPNSTWGAQLVSTTEVLSFLPTAPLQGVWPGTLVATNGYGQQNFGATTFEEVLDPDLHNLIAGTQLISVPGNPDDSGKAQFTPQLDPAVLAGLTPPAANAPGFHTVMLRRNQAKPDTQQFAAAILAFQVNVGGTPVPVPPPPPVCTLPAVLQDGACVTPIAVPPPVIVPPPPPPPPTPTFVKVKGMCAEELFSDGSVVNRCLDLP